MGQRLRLILSIAFIAILAPSQTIQAGSAPSLSEWHAAICALPTNRPYNHWRSAQADPSVNSGFAAFADSKSKQWDMFNKAAEAFANVQKEHKNNALLWVPSNEGSLIPTWNKFQPFVEKKIINPNEKLILKADLHGDVISLSTMLMDLKKQGKIDNNFKLAKDYHFMALGDYVDRGKYGAEVWYTLMRLATANPDKVTLIRGNHEDLSLNNGCGFKNELKEKFGNDWYASSRYEKMNNIYNLLPVASCIINKQGNVVQGCHAGIELGYVPDKLLNASKTQKYQQIGRMNRRTFAEEIIANPHTPQMVKNALIKSKGDLQDNVKLDSPYGLGLCWSDFYPHNHHGGDPITNRLARGKQYTKEVVTAVLDTTNARLKNCRIIAFVRGHQHCGDKNDPMMKKIITGNGVGRLYGKQNGILGTSALQQNEVLTLNVAPDNNLGEGVGNNTDTHLELTCSSDGQWHPHIYKHYPKLNNPGNNPGVKDTQSFINASNCSKGLAIVALAGLAYYGYKKYQVYKHAKKLLPTKPAL